MYMGISWILCEYEVYGVVRYKYDMPGLPPSVRRVLVLLLFSAVSSGTRWV